VFYLEKFNITWGGTSDEYGNGMAVDGENNVYLCGQTTSFGAGNYDAFLVKYDHNENQLWNLTWGNTSSDRGNDMAVDGENYVYLCGDTYSFGAGNNDAFLVKYASNRDQLWNITWGGASYDGASDIVIDEDNNVYISGQTHSFGAGLYDAFLVKYNPDGSQLWNVTWGGNASDSGNGVVVDSLNNIYISIDILQVLDPVIMMHFL